MSSRVIGDLGISDFLEKPKISGTQQIIKLLNKIFASYIGKSLLCGGNRLILILSIGSLIS